MKIKIIFIGVSVFLYAFFCVPFANAGTEKIIISEVQITGGTGHTNDEFVEIYNAGNDDQTLTNWELRKKTKSDDSARGALFHKFEGDLTISAGKYFLWTNKDSTADFISLFDIQSKNKTSPNLTDDNSLGLYDNGGILIDAITWGSGHIGPFLPSTLYSDNPPGNKSLARNITTLALSLLDKPTPTNSRGETQEDPPPIIYDSDVRINEILANPSGDENTDEFIELFNTSDKLVDLSSWTIKDASSGKYIFPNNTKIQPKDFLVVYRTDFVFALNNSDETVYLLDPNGAEKDKISYKTTKEDVSYNYTATGWRGGTLTPGETNQPNNLPETTEKVPENGYKGVEVSFNAQGKDTDNDALKYTWDFGDDHKSYKEVTTHTYEENGTYTVTLETSDGKDDTLETFTIKIESMPRKDVRITSLLPNPSGNDTGIEWIIIENREKKSVNLKDYSIATGWKKLSNHPIREDFIIKPSKEAKLTQEFSSFSLPNQKGRIELRAPDGKVLQKIEYKLDKPIAEDAVYHKEKGSAWKWESLPKKIPATPQKEIIPLVPVPQEIKPTEIPQPIQEDIPIEPVKTKSNQISLDPDRPLPQDVLAYGTRVQMPDSITLALSSDEKMDLVSLSKSSPLPEEESLFTKINTSLNDFLNSPH